MISRKQAKADSTELSIKVTVNIGSKVIEQDIEDLLFIPRADKLTLPVVLQILSENPILHARWNFLYNDAVYEFDVMKTKFEVWLSKKSQEYRKSLESVKTKGRVTDKMVEDMIKADPEYEKINNDLAQAEKNMKHIFVLANGFGEKGEKIINIASLLKWEGDTLIGKRFVSNQHEYHHIERDFEKKEDYSFDPKVNDGWPT